MYEYTFPAWGSQFPDGRLYVDISNYWTQKAQAIACYESQLRPWPHPVSMKAAETMAQARGMACGYKLAEMFFVVMMKDIFL